MVKEDWRKREHKKIAVEKLDDAVVLFKKERYLASLYIVGYVFEIWIQYELTQLGEIRLDEKRALAVITRLSVDAIAFYNNQKNFTATGISSLWEQSKSLRKEVSQKNLTVDKLYDFITKIIDILGTNNNREQPKELNAIIKERLLFWAIVKGRLDSKSPDVDGHHDTIKLLEILTEWYWVLGESRKVEIIHKSLDSFKSLEWKVELRYEYTKGNTLKQEYCRKAKKAIELAYQLLTETMNGKAADLPNIQKLKC